MRSDLARRERQDKAFESAMAQADEEAELATYQLVGWFSLRSSSGLLSSDVEFHNRHFNHADDLALVIWREADTQVITELYARTENRVLSGGDYRWSSVRLSTELRWVSEPIPPAMRVKVTTDSYLRAYRDTEENEKRNDLKRIASSAKRSMLALIPKRMRGEDYSITGGDALRAYARQPLDTGPIFRQTEDYPEAMTRPTTVGAEPSRVGDVSRMLEPKLRQRALPCHSVSGRGNFRAADGDQHTAEAQRRAVAFDRTRLRDLFGDYFCRAGGKRDRIGQRKDCADHASGFPVRRFGITR